MTRMQLSRALYVVLPFVLVLPVIAVAGEAAVVFGDEQPEHVHPVFDEGALLATGRVSQVEGAAYRTKRESLGFSERDVYDPVAAHFENKHASIPLVSVDPGTIATRRDQDGVFASLQVGL